MEFKTRPSPHGGFSDVPPVPQGWAARFDERYQAWFYVNTQTLQSQWEQPLASGFPSFGIENSSRPRYSEPILYHASDEDLARRLQVEEDNEMRQRPIGPYDASLHSPQAPVSLGNVSTKPAYTHATNHGSLAPPGAVNGGLHGKKKRSWSNLKDTLTGKNLTEEDKNSKTYKIAEKIGDKVTGKGTTGDGRHSESSNEKKDKKDHKASKYTGKAGKAVGKHFAGAGEDGGDDDGGGGDIGGDDDGGGIGEIIGAIFGA